MNDTADQAAAREAINLAEALEMQRIAALNTPGFRRWGTAITPFAGKNSATTRRACSAGRSAPSNTTSTPPGNHDNHVIFKQSTANRQPWQRP